IPAVGPVGLGVPYESPLLTERLSLPEAALRRYVGSYEVDGAVWDLSLQNGKLFLRSQQYPGFAIEIIPVTETDFILPGGDAGIDAVLNGEGSVKELVVKQGVSEGHARKVQ